MSTQNSEDEYTTPQQIEFVPRAVESDRRAQKKLRKKKRWKKVRRGAMIFLLAGAVCHTAINIYASVLLNRELAQVRQKGEPLTIAEMAPPRVPAAQNAAPLYQQATEALRLSKAAIPELEQLKPADWNRIAAPLLQQNHKALELGRAAALKPQCRFARDWNQSPIQMTYPHYVGVRKLARLLSAQARLSAHNGDIEGALRDTRAIFVIADHLQNEPVLIGFLVARAIEAIANKALGRVLDMTPISASRARLFASSLPATDWSAMFRRAMMGERTFSVWAFDEERSHSTGIYYIIGRDESLAPLRWLGRPLDILWTPFFKLDEVVSLRLWKQIIASTQPMTIPAPPNLAFQLDRQVKNAPRYAVLTRLLFPVFSRARQNHDASEVSRRQREIALALSAHRALHGSYPAQLSQVQPLSGQTLPLDPYSSAPFIYRGDGREMVLYSVGINGRDDGGRGPWALFDSPASSIPGDDIMWAPKRNAEH